MAIEQPGDQVLSPTDQARLARAIGLLDKADLIIQKMSDCGIDCRAQAAYSQAIRGRATGLLQHFGSERRQA